MITLFVRVVSVHQRVIIAKGEIVEGHPRLHLQVGPTIALVLLLVFHRINVLLGQHTFCSDVNPVLQDLVVILARPQVRLYKLVCAVSGMTSYGLERLRCFGMGHTSKIRRLGNRHS